MKYIDLHTHTTSSDGTFSPNELIDYALEKKLAAIAITDHDTINAIIPAKEYLGKSNTLEIISGIEFSTSTPHYKSDIHILGLYIDENSQVFNNILLEIVGSRIERNKKMINNLNRLGINITYDDIIKNSTNGIITRAHFANALIDKGYAKSKNEAFQKYLGSGCPAFVPREKHLPKKIIQIIRDAGGVAILAHPTLYGLNLKELDSLIYELVGYGLKGIEGIYSLYNKSEENYIKEFAKQYNLVISGGSDFHGTNKTDIDLGVGRGNLKIPYDLLEPIKNARK